MGLHGRPFIPRGPRRLTIQQMLKRTCVRIALVNGSPRSQTSRSVASRDVWRYSLVYHGLLINPGRNEYRRGAVSGQIEAESALTFRRVVIRVQAPWAAVRVVGSTGFINPTNSMVLRQFDPVGEFAPRTGPYTLARNPSPPRTDDGGSTGRSMPWSIAMPTAG